MVRFRLIGNDDILDVCAKVDSKLFLFLLHLTGVGSIDFVSSFKIKTLT